MELSRTINLVWPSDPEYSYNLLTPLGLGYLASYLSKKGFDVKVHDLMFSKDIKSDNRRAIYGVSIATPLMGIAMVAIKKIKRLNHANIIIVGGPHASCVPEELIQEKEIDYLVFGEGEETLYELCDRLLNGKPIEDVKGIYYKDEKGVHYTGARELIGGLDSLPFPRHDLFPLKEYAKNRIIKEMGILSSRGCPYNCDFCQPYLKTVFGEKVRYRLTKNVVDEIEYLKKNYKTHIVTFHDDLMNPSYFRGICKEIIARKLKILWRCQTRARLDKSLVRLMKKAGCIGITFGVESGSQKVLEAINKMQKIEIIKKSFRVCREFGIFTHALIMVGNRSENMADVYKTLELLKVIRPFSMAVSITTPHPGTHLFQRLKEENKLPMQLDWSAMHFSRESTFYVQQTSGLSREEVVKARNMLMNEFAKAGKISRFSYMLSYIKDFWGLNNIFHFVIKNPKIAFKGLLTLITISKTGAGIRYTNPRQSFYGKNLK